MKARISIPLKPQENENINVEQGFDILISRSHSFKLATLSIKLFSSKNNLVGLETVVNQVFPIG